MRTIPKWRLNFRMNELEKLYPYTNISPVYLILTAQYASTWNTKRKMPTSLIDSNIVGLTTKRKMAMSMIM